jgi:hypothetical protein
MIPARLLLSLTVLAIALPLYSQEPTPEATVASTVDRQISMVEKEVLDASDAMPENKFNFSPESLNIAGSDYKGVRSFAVQVKHVGASNYALCSPLTGDKFPKDYLGGDGPQNLKTKAEIVKFAHESFAQCHKAVATLTPQNMLQPPGDSKTPRLYRTCFAAAHAFDHYGQMVVYLRMNGIVPPASRAKSD